jgi:hypothetical protein
MVDLRKTEKISFLMATCVMDEPRANPTIESYNTSFVKKNYIPRYPQRHA